MRVKIADVLVDDGTHVDRFAAYESPRAGRGRDIYGGHSRLWALWVYVDDSLSELQRDVVRAFLAEKLGVAWEHERARWGPAYWEWVDRLALAQILTNTSPGANEISELLRDQEVSSAVAARTSDDTFKARCGKLRRVAAVKAARSRSGGDAQ
jgi:hypothetical protein